MSNIDVFGGQFSRNIESDSVDRFAQYVANLERISTPREHLLTFQAGLINPQVLAKAKESRFDHAPVLNDQRTLIGIVAVSHAEELSKAARQLEPTDPELYLRELDQSVPLLLFLQEIAEHRAVVIRAKDEAQDPDWFALVTISDLNRHPFRSHLYPMIAELESALAQLIDSHFQDPLTWIRRTSEDSQVRHFGQWRVAQEKGVDMSPIISCTLMDLVNIVAKTPELWKYMDYSSRNEFERDISPLRDLRNQIMHPVRPLILSQEEVKKLRTNVFNVLTLTKNVTLMNESLAQDGKAPLRHLP